MTGLLANLQPRFELAGAIIFEELEEISEVIFIQKGNMDIGYELNKRKRFVLRFHNHSMVGAYNCSFNEPSIFIYKCQSNCEGYSIRKEEWINLLNMDEDINDWLREKVKSHYFKNIKYKVFAIKETDIRKLQKR
jgi:CRP-like cAMP-binding protein